jgi:hypothetical protein
MNVGILRIVVIAAALCVLPQAALPALDLWRHPEAAEQNAIFLDAAFAGVSFTDSFYFAPPVELRLEYMLPVFVPLSVGAYFKTPNPNLTSFGARLAYHFDIRDRKTDLYAVYVFDLGFLRNELLEAYGDQAQPVHFYDFRAGVRRLFGSFFCLALETDFKAQGLLIMLSIKLY